MAVHASHAALPYPIKGARFSLPIPYLDADGDPTAPTTPDTEVSKDNGAASDAAEEVSATSGMDGMSLLTLSGAETDCSIVALNAKVASGPKATLAIVRPHPLAIVGSGTLSAGSAGGGTLGTLLAYDVTGCFIKTTGGTGGGGTGGANNQARRIITYNTTTGAFTVVPDWETTPSTDTTYDVLLPTGVTLGMLRTLNPTTAGRTLTIESDGMAHADVKEWLGTAPAAYSATRGTAGTALPAAAADAAGGLPISDAGGLDLDAKLANTNEVTVARMGALTDWINGGRLDLILDARASQTSVNTIDDFLDSEITTLLNRTKNLWYHIASDGDGTSGGDGTPGSPVDLLATAIANGAKRIKYTPRNLYNNEGDNDYITLGAVTIPTRAIIDFNGNIVSDMQAPTWTGSGGAYLFSSSHIPAQLEGSGTINLPDSAKFSNLMWYSGNYVTGYGYWTHSRFQSAASLTLDHNAGGTSYFYGIGFGDPSTPFTITLTGASANTKLQMEDVYGNLKIEGMKTASRLLHYGWGKLIIGATCVGGTIQVTSHVEIFENDGTTSWDHTNTTNRPTIELVSEPGTISGFTTAAKAQIEAEVDDALNAAVPGSPTAGSINERIKTMDDADMPGRLPAALESGRIAAALNSTGNNAVADAYLDRADGVEAGITPRQAMRAKLAVLAGVIANAGEGTETFKNPGGGTTRVTVTVDEDGNRSAVVINA